MEQKTESKKVIVFKAEPKEQAAYDEIARRYMLCKKFADLLATRVRKGIPVIFENSLIMDRGYLIRREVRTGEEAGISVYIYGVGWAFQETGKLPSKDDAFPEWAMRYLGELEVRND